MYHRLEYKSQGSTVIEELQKRKRLRDYLTNVEVP